MQPIRVTEPRAKVRPAFLGLASALLWMAWTFPAPAAEDETAPKLPTEEAASPETVGEQPRVRYWLREPSSGEELEPPRGEQVGPSPARAEAPTVQAAKATPERTGRTPEERRVAMQDLFRKMFKEAEQAFGKKDYDRCASICRNILTADPRHQDAAKLLSYARERQGQADEKVTFLAGERKAREMVLEAEQRSVRPPVRAPEARPAWPRREDDPSLPARRKMAEILEERVTVDFVNADLEWVLNTLFILTGINIISDPAALADKSLTLHVENLPLREVLDYIIRVNEGIQLSFTGNAVWITASSGDDLKKLMIVKVYPIHHGLVTSRAASGAGRGGGGGGGGGRGGGARTPLRSSAQQRQQPQQQQGEQAQSDESYLEIVLGWLQDQQDTQSFPEGSEWFIDRQSNQLVVYTTPAGHDKIQSFLDAFDQPAIQVLIKARFLEVSGEDNFALGVTLDSMAGQFSYHGYKVPFAFQSEYAATPPGTLFASGNIFQVVGSRLDPQFQITLKALLGNRRTRILSEPQILAINNKEAFLDVTTEFSYITDLNLESYDTIDANGNRVTYTALVPQFDTEQVGFTLYVTPSVGRDLKTINLHLRPVIDSLAQGQQISQFQQYDITQPGQGQQNQPLVVLRPTIDQTSLETDVVLDDNGFVIIGGLIRNRYEVTEKKVPGLHRIPYLGYLFKSKQNQKLTSNLVVIVEAQIITQRGRTYRTEPSPDDGDVREGGANRAPGQVSELQPLPNSPRPPTLQPATAGQGAWRVSEQER